MNHPKHSRNPFLFVIAALVAICTSIGCHSTGSTDPNSKSTDTTKTGQIPEVLHIMSPQGDSIRVVFSLSGDGSRIAGLAVSQASNTSSIYVWNTTDGAIIKHILNTGFASWMYLNKDGTKLLVEDAGYITTLYDVATAAKLFTINDNNYSMMGDDADKILSQLRYSDGTKAIVVFNSNGDTVEKTLIPGSDFGPDGLSADGKTAIITQASGNYNLYTWDLGTNKKSSSYTAQADLYDGNISRDGVIFMGLDREDNHMRMINTVTGVESPIHPAHNTDAFAMSTDHDTYAIGTDFTSPGNGELWSYKTNTKIRDLSDSLHASFFDRFEFSDDGSRLAAGTWYELTVWKVK